MKQPLEETKQGLSPTMDFSSKVVCVTGGSRGIGRAIIKAFDALGATCGIIYRSDDTSAETTLSELRGNQHKLFKADVSNPDNAAKVVNDLIEAFGIIDVFVNNAGIGSHHPIDEVNYADWQAHFKKIMGLNFFSGANLSHQISQHMIKQKAGYIINVTSRGAFRGEPLQPAYGASKAAMNSLTQSLAFSLAPHNIFVGAVAPGFVETDMAKERLEGPRGDGIRSQSPMNRVAKPEEVSHAVVLMASSPIWMTGGIFDVNGASYFRT